MTRLKGRRRFYARAGAGRVVELPANTKPIAWCPINVDEWTDLPAPMRDDLIWNAPYSLSRSITREEIALRVARALRGAGLAPVNVGPSWKKRELDRKDEVTASRWLAALSPTERRLIAARAACPPHSWRELGNELNVSHETARNQYEVALDKLLARAKSATSA